MTGEASLPLDHERALFYEGIDLFNHHLFFDAHEVWEDVWREVYGHHKLFYQGLIQCAVSLEHLHRGNLRGARHVFYTCQTKFIPLAPVYMGIASQPLLESIGSVLASGEVNGPDDTPASGWPTIILRYDPFATGEAEQRRRESVDR